MKGKGTRGLTVEVENDRFEKAMRLFKKKVDEAGILKELRDRESYVKPSIDRKLKKNAAVKRWKKTLSQNQLPKKMY